MKLNLTRVKPKGPQKTDMYNTNRVSYDAKSEYPESKRHKKKGENIEYKPHITMVNFKNLGLLFAFIEVLFFMFHAFKNK